MSCLQGHLLVASPKLGDPNFFRAVVLLVKHNDEGALGLVLNRPSNISLNDIWSKVCESPCTAEGSIQCGGPCPGPLMALHGEEFLADSEVLPNLYLSSDKEKLAHLVLKHGTSVRFYAGYSGWSAEQLDAELAQGAWFTAPAGLEHAFWPQDDLWERLCGELAATIRIAGIEMKHVPPDPSMN